MPPKKAHQEVDPLAPPPTEVSFLACSYAVLLLHDEGIPVTADKIMAIVTAAGLDVAPFWGKTAARVAQSGDINLMLSSLGAGAAVGGGGAAPAAAAPSAAAPADAPAASKKKEPEPEPEEDDDVGMGGLFD